ncbi:methionine synthase [Planctomycetales bacterium ZRK34]|nr:methionine synthase [Planctomycetales bacterium ZRK34]
MGTQIHALDLDLETDYLGKENCTEVLVLTRPDAIQQIHENYLAAGADGVETDTFGAMPHVLCEFDLVDRCREINRKAVQTARAACDKFSTPDKPRFVVASMGPGTKLITLGQIDWATMFASYREAALGLIEGEPDVILLETCQDIGQVKCAVNAILDAMDEAKVTTDQLPIMVQVTIEQTGTMLTGTEIGAAAVALHNYPILSIGMNCATGPTDMAEHVGWLAKHWDRHISLLPNAGLPSLVAGETVYPLGPKPFAEVMAKFVDQYGLSIVGGCCGTTPGHIEELVKAVGERPRTVVDKDPMPAGCSSLYSVTEYDQDVSLLNIGERCNASGSRAFKRLLENEDWDEMVSLAREQMREGSHVLDVNVDYAGRDNAADMAEIVHRFVRQVNAPLMLDSTQPATIEAGLRQAGGKCLINSANLEDGEEKFGAMCALAKKYNAGLVLGTIDEDPDEAMARTEDRKIEIARRMYKLATEKYGLKPADILFDPLVLPISTGMDKDRRSALETIAGVKRIAEEMPDVQTTVGLSNVSFGLKPAARQVLNSAFQHELQHAGLTSAIVHVSKILPKTRIDDKLWAAAMDLIYDRRPAEKVTLRDGTLTDDPLQIFVDLFPDDAAEQTTKQDISELPLEERLQKHIIDGEKKNLTETLDEAMGKYPPLEIINDHLLEGMKVVGELFGSGQMQLPFVLQSAEVMKMAVAHLEPHMEKIEGQSKGRIVLATVKGDVHDIGKNLVDIILTNNGYDVINLGIKQPIADIIAAYHEHKADAIGLSGLLVKSVNVMEENLNELNAQLIDVPMLLGGAALSKHYCDSHLRSVYKGKTYHGKDAFEGLRIMDHLMGGKSQALDAEIDARLAKRAEAEKIHAAAKARSEAAAAAGTITAARSEVATDIEVPPAPFWGDRLVEQIKLDDIYPFINRVALYRGQWQFKKGAMSDEEYAHFVEDEVDPIFDRLAAQCRDESILKPQVVYGYYPCQSAGDDLILLDPEDHDREIERFTFPRQAGKKRLCISDFFRSVDSDVKDVIGLSCVTMGAKASEITRELFESNNYTEYLYLHGFSVECAEALAELWHKRMRQELGIAGDDAASPRKLFTQQYRGSRYSFGYPACPEMSDQEILFRLLSPDRIGCTLTDNWQIDPEQSTSAIIVHHPEAKYFNI